MVAIYILNKVRNESEIEKLNLLNNFKIVLVFKFRVSDHLYIIHSLHNYYTSIFDKADIILVIEWRKI